MITGGAEAWMVADALAAAKVPVMTGGINNIPRSFSSLGTLQENAALLVKAGVTIAMISDSYAMGMVSNVRNVRYEAGNAVAAGLPWDAALRAVTLSPAEAWGVADQIGSLAAGKAGNVVVWSGDPFEFATQADAVIVRGKRVVSMTRQDELTDRYKRRPATYRAP
jgi:imidazolonepropionase-like amidohydrolase